MFVWIVLWVSSSIVAINNGVGRRPTMGWGSWYAYGIHGCQHCNESAIRTQADHLVKLGYRDAGYTLVWPDGCWAAPTRDPTTNRLRPDLTAFPSGMRGLGDYIHGLGLQYGIYSDSGATTCQRRPASLGHEELDASTFADWGVDFLKYDNCDNKGSPVLGRYRRMSQALNATKRPIVFNMCEWGVANPAVWGPQVANSWRVSRDIQPHWDSILHNLGVSNVFAGYAGPGGFNDPDQLQVGYPALTEAQQIAQFCLWSVAKAPLILSVDLPSITPTVSSVLLNPEIIAINQDVLGVQGRRLRGSYPDGHSPEVSTAIHVVPNDDFALERIFIPQADGSLMSTDGRCLTASTASSDISMTPCRHDSLQLWIGGYFTEESYGFQNITLRSVGRPGWCVGQVSGVVTLVKCSTASTLGPLWTVDQPSSTIYTVDWKTQWSLSTLLPPIEVWGGPLIGDRRSSVVLFNRDVPHSVNITVWFTDLGYGGDQTLNVRDALKRKELGHFTGSYTTVVGPTEVAVLVVSALS